MKTWIVYIFAFIGAALILTSIGNAISIQLFNQDAVPATGEVVELLETEGEEYYLYAPVIEYTTAEGELITYSHSSYTYPSSYAIGETVPMLYKASKPSKARIDSPTEEWFLVGFMFFMGLLFAVFGFALPVYKRYRKRVGQKLKETGTSVQAKIIGLEKNRAIVIQGKSPFRILAQYHNTQTNTVYDYTSDNIWWDPTEFVKEGALVTVYVDRNNPKKHSMDLSFLPKHS
ncbi:MAG: DUF3592 domain-containing protein [Candidatus Magasanikbacteria bacterium]|jgi:hypothetical protein|nr:DUF3592 domain-containing protein [Candidatus Magasanikbacteria bacterium]